MRAWRFSGVSSCRARATSSAGKVAASLRAHARDIHRTGRCIGMWPFIVYAHRRRVRAHALLGQKVCGYIGDIRTCVGRGLRG